MLDAYDRVVEVLIILSGAGALAFTISYIGFFQSGATAAGRALRDVGIALSVLFILVMTSSMFGDYPGRPLVRIAVYAFLAIMLWRLVLTLWRYRNRSIPAIPLRTDGIPRTDTFLRKSR